jgi:hypothetical protein
MSNANTHFAPVVDYDAPTQVQDDDEEEEEAEDIFKIEGDVDMHWYPGKKNFNSALKLGTQMFDKETGQPKFIMFGPEYNGELTPAELTYVHAYALLFKRWGYRTAPLQRNKKDAVVPPGSEHERFELRLHKEDSVYGYLTPFTDVLFRNLQQLDHVVAVPVTVEELVDDDDDDDEKKSDSDQLFKYVHMTDRVLPCDGVCKFACAIDPSQCDDRDVKHRASLFLEEFFICQTDEDNYPLLVHLADEGCAGCTLGFIALIYAANALIAIIDQDYEAAYAIASAYVNIYDKYTSSSHGSCAPSSSFLPHQ